MNDVPHLPMVALESFGDSRNIIARTIDNPLCDGTNRTASRVSWPFQTSKAYDWMDHYTPFRSIDDLAF